jgi:outer membrane protein
MANYQKMIQEYQGGAATMTDVIRQDKEREIAQLEENIQKFQQDAQVSFQKKQTELLQPVYEKIGKAIEEVANEGSFTYVLSTRIGSIDVILFAIPENDISDLVLKKMGITPQNN